MQKFIFFIIIALALVGVFGLRSRHEAEKRRQAAVARQAEIAREQAEKAEAERQAKERQEAEKVRQAEAARAREAAKAKQLEQRQTARAKQMREQARAKDEAAAKTAAEQRGARAAACEKILETLKGATLRPWKNVPETDNPETAKGDNTFYCVFPDDDGGRMLLELRTTFGRNVSVRRLDAASDAESYEPNEFRHVSAVFPNLLMKDDRVYFRPSRSETDPCRVPSEDGAFNPSERDFGLIYETVRMSGLKMDSFVYGVYFRPFGMDVDIPVAKVSFGQEIPFGTFKEKVAAWTKRNASALAKGRAAAKAWKPTVVLTDKTQVKRRMDGVTEVPREFVFTGNKHRYAEGTSQYLNEERKENAARRKWQTLYEEAKRQEELARKSPQSGGAGFLESGTVVYRLYEERSAK